MKRRTISFSPTSNDIVGLIDPPTPAFKVLPPWYKAQPVTTNGEDLRIQDRGVVNVTVKKCMPVLDDLIAGYIVCLASDVQVVSDENQNQSFHWSLILPDTVEPLISSHSTAQVSHFPIPNGYSINPFKFTNYWKIKTPPGYSCLFKHPVWHGEVPFLSLSGIVDTDTHPVPVNFPFLIRSGWSGVIYAGTPIMQIVPFRREFWSSEVVADDSECSLGRKEYNKSSRKMMNRYKENWREVKQWK